MSETQPLAGDEDLKRKSVLAMLWSVLRAGWVNLSAFVVFVVLARLLGPAEFGVFALSSLFVEIGRIVSQTFMGDAIIRQLDLEEDLADTAFWTTLGLSTLMGGLAWMAAPYYAEVVQHPEVVPVVRWLAVMLPVSSLGMIHIARLTRDFGHKSIAFQTMIAGLFSGGAAIVAALAGWGVWALVVQVAVSAVMTTALALNAYRWVPRLNFHWRQLKSVLVFSASMVATRLLWMLLVRIQDIFIARWYDATAVGTYRIAWRLIELMGQAVLGPLGGVSMVTLSRLQQQTARFNRTYNRVMGVSAVFVLPVLLGLGALAHELIPLAFGERWAASADVAVVLAFMAVPFVTNFFSSPALAAMNRPLAILGVAAVQVGLTLVLTWTLVRYGVVAVALAYVLRAYLTLPIQQWALWRYAGVKPMDTVRSLRAPLVAALVMAGVVWVTKPALLSALGDGWLMVAAAVALGAAIYTALMLVIGREVLRAMREALRELKGGRPA